jgi:TolB-like protein
MKGFFDELKRRNVVRVGIAYIVVGWLVFQVGEVLFPTFGAPEWIFKSVILLIALGFPLALVFAWAFELTPEGVKKTKEVDASVSITPSTGKRLNQITIAALVVALGYLVWQSQADDPVSDPISEPVAAAVVVEPDADPRAEIEHAPPGQRTIAVLPFVNMSSDEEQEWFADGLTEEILNALARTPDLLVTARTSSFVYKDSEKEVTEIADSLGVAHVLEGSVRRSSDRLRVTAQLIRASDGFHLWSQTYDRDFADLIDIQENVAFEIANALETAMDPEALARMVSAGTASVPAFEAYLQGLAHGVSLIQTGDAYLFLDAKEAFEKAISIDPEFATAHWHLAQFWAIQLSETNIVAGITEYSRREMRAFYEDAIDNAIRYEDDPASRTLYEAHKADMGLQMQKALRLNTDYLAQRPLDQSAQQQQLNLLATVGVVDKIPEAVREFERIDGHDVLVTNTSITRLVYAGDDEYLKEFSGHAVAQFPDEVFIHYQAHRALLWAGDIDGAAGLLPFILSSDMPESSRYLVLLRQACAEGRTEDARKLYERGLRQYAGDASIIWLSHIIMDDPEAAEATLTPLDDPSDLRGLADFLIYGTFDPRPYPNLMALLESQGIAPRDPVVPPYQCRN